MTAVNRAPVRLDAEGEGATREFGITSPGSLRDLEAHPGAFSSSILDLKVIQLSSFNTLRLDEKMIVQRRNVFFALRRTTVVCGGI